MLAWKARTVPWRLSGEAPTEVPHKHGVLTHRVLPLLRLSGCLLTDEGSSSLAWVLDAKRSRLRKLDLSYNHLGDSGAKLRSARLPAPLLDPDSLR